MAEFDCVFCESPAPLASGQRPALIPLSNGAKVFAHPGCAQDFEMDLDEDRALTRYPEAWIG